MQHKLSVVITASPIPSHPSPVVLQNVLQSIRDHVSSLLQCHLIIVFDGCRIADKPMSKLGKVTPDQLEGYRAFVSLATRTLMRHWGSTVSDWISNWGEGDDLEPPQFEFFRLHPKLPPNPFPPLPELYISHRETTAELPGITCIQVVGERLGQAFAVQQALEYVRTNYVFACQHDWRFNAHLDTSSFIALLDAEPRVNYVGFISRRNKGYAKQSHPVGFPPATIPSGHLNNVPLCRSFFWFDKNHIARTCFYRNEVFGDLGLYKRGDFIEDTFGHRIHLQIRLGGKEAWEKIGMYLYYPENGELLILVHVNGRHYLSEEGKKRLEKRGREKIEE